MQYELQGKLPSDGLDFDTLTDIGLIDRILAGEAKQ